MHIDALRFFRVCSIYDTMWTVTSTPIRSRAGQTMHRTLRAAMIPRDERFDDQALVTVDVGRYRPNAWGLHDMHGNVWEWTRSAYKAYPYRDDDGRNHLAAGDRGVVRGGSWQDRPERCRSAFRLSYPTWQKVHDVGLRVVCEVTPPEGKIVLAGADQ